MGGCCCCSSKGIELNGTLAHYHCPKASTEHELLSSHHGAASTLSTGLLVDTNLGTSPPNTCRPPPAPVPYDMDLGHPRTHFKTRFCILTEKIDPTARPLSIGTRFRRK